MRVSRFCLFRERLNICHGANIAIAFDRSSVHPFDKTTGKRLWGARFPSEDGPGPAQKSATFPQADLFNRSGSYGPISTIGVVPAMMSATR